MKYSQGSLWMVLAIATVTAIGTGCVAPNAALPSSPKERRFTLTYEVQAPATPADSGATLWLPWPPDTHSQTIHDAKVESPLDFEIVDEPRYGNRALRLEIPPGNAESTITMTFDATRHELRRDLSASRLDDGLTAEAREGLWLGPNRRIPLGEMIAAQAHSVTAGLTEPHERARAIYDYAVDTMRYDKSGTGWGQGDIYWACDAKRGNCTDFHAMVIGFSRSVDIPARFEIGFPLPTDRSEGQIAGYHCWTQLYLAEEGWIPLDASEAHKHPDRRDYLFGNLDPDRIVFSIGRDLLFPGMQGEPLNYFAYPYVEQDGSPGEAVEWRVSFRDHS